MSKGKGLRKPPRLSFLTGDEMRNLTTREEGIIELIAKGLSNKMIAAELGTSEQTIKKQVSHMLLKLNAGNRAHAVAIWLGKHSCRIF